MEHKELVDKINREWEEMKGLLSGRADAEVKKFGDVLGETKAKLDAYNQRLDTFEIMLQRGMKAAEDPKKSEDRSAEHKAFFKLLRQGPERLDSKEADLLKKMQTKLMTVSDDTSGGYGAPDEFDYNIIKGVVLVSPWRSQVRVRNTGMRSVKVMKRTGTFAAVWVAETETRAETTGLTYGLEEIPTHEIYAMVDISRQDLEDVAFNLEAELNSEFSEQFAKAEGIAITTGSGKGKPEGVVTNAAVSQDSTGDANLLTFEGLNDVIFNGKADYLTDALYVFNLKTLGTIRKMKDGTGQPLWAPFASGVPSTVNGYPYAIMPDMPDVGAGLVPVAFGSFKRAYQLVDRVALSIERDPFTQANKGAIRFYARKRLGGQVVLAEAIRKLKVQ